MILVRIFFSLLIIGPIVIAVLNHRKNKNLAPPERIPYLSTLINSAILYAVAYNVIFFLQELFLVLGKNAIGLTAYLYHNNHSWDGFHPMASLMQGSGALAIFIIGLICLAWFQFIRKSASIWKLLVLWLAFHGLIQSVPQVMVAFFAPETDVGQALAGYLGLSQGMLVLLAVVSIVAMIFINILMARPLLELAPPELDLSNPKARLLYIRLIAVGAAFAGSFLIIPFRIPPLAQMTPPFIIFFFSIPWIWAMAARIDKVDSIPNPVNEKIRWEPVVILVGILLIFRFVLAPGITF